jgi:thymidylate synthase
MINVISGKSADEVWVQAANLFKNKLKLKTRPSRCGEVIEILHTIFSIENPRQRWVFSRKPGINPAFALAEIVWIMNGAQDASIINFWNPVLPKYAGYYAKYHGAYGFRLRRHFGIDQLERAYLALKNNPDSRQVILQIWDPASDFPHKDGSPVSEDIPCNVSSLLKMRDNRLEWMQVIRSNDIYRGLPYNFVQFTTLQEVLAGWLEVEPGSYNQVSDSLHLYQSDNKKAFIGFLDSHPENTDSLLLPKSESEYFFNAIFKKMQIMVDPHLVKSDLYKILKLDKENKAFQNILLVIAADVARRKKWPEAAKDLMDSCTNEAYCKLWDSWINRFN